ncbi:MAG: nitroreductase family deazaflavin-dependent oxidoreductase, partial [Candidatus Dormibacteraeota bacterium]|nr:nitroreductase family deazaflavin-dependent oxidoreductase [Candidatus Dormibacteraeota bacterium]
ADPDVTVQVKGDVLPVRARTATAEEKPELWRIMTTEWPDYDTYQTRTSRDIPVVVLEPR